MTGGVWTLGTTTWTVPEEKADPTLGMIAMAMTVSRDNQKVFMANQPVTMTSLTATRTIQTIQDHTRCWTGTQSYLQLLKNLKY